MADSTVLVCACPDTNHRHSFDNVSFQTAWLLVCGDLASYLGATI